MPLTLNVGLSQKMGLPDYGSLGASCHVELELGSHLLDRNPDVFQQEVRAAFAACRQAVEEELDRLRPSQSSQSANQSADSGNCPRETHSAWRPITTRQLDYVRQLAAQFEELGPHDLERFVEQRFERPLAELSSYEASSLIRMLRQIKSGRRSLAAATDRLAA